MPNTKTFSNRLSIFHHFQYSNSESTKMVATLYLFAQSTNYTRNKNWLLIGQFIQLVLKCWWTGFLYSFMELQDVDWCSEFRRKSKNIVPSVIYIATVRRIPDINFIASILDIPERGNIQYCHKYSWPGPSDAIYAPVINKDSFGYIQVGIAGICFLTLTPL